MVLELVEVDVKPGTEADFEAAFAKCIPLLKRAPGCRSVRVMRVIETPSRYRAFIEWEKLENHTEGFRGSPDHKQMIATVGPYFERSQIEHHKPVIDG
jgi:heme-degrading monooxygenase HmoA